MSSRTLTMLADHRQRSLRATRWRKLSADRQALLVLAHPRKGETSRDLACGFRIGTSTVYRYVREAITLLAEMAPTLAQVIEIAHGKAAPLDVGPEEVEPLGHVHDPGLGR